MKRKRMVIAVIAVLLVSLFSNHTTQAAPPRLKLTFNGTTANCYAEVRGSAYIEVTMELWVRNTEITSWSASGNGVVILNREATVLTGETYTLKLKGTIGGAAFQELSVSRTNWEMNK